MTDKKHRVIVVTVEEQIVNEDAITRQGSTEKVLREKSYVYLDTFTSIEEVIDAVTTCVGCPGIEVMEPTIKGAMITGDKSATIQ